MLGVSSVVVGGGQCMCDLLNYYLLAFSVLHLFFRFFKCRRMELSICRKKISVSVSYNILMQERNGGK